MERVREARHLVRIIKEFCEYASNTNRVSAASGLHTRILPPKNSHLSAAYEWSYAEDQSR